MKAPASLYPGEFEKNITDIFGAEGEAWLTSIPSRVEALGALWNFSSPRVLPSLTYSYVATVSLQRGGEAILKLAPEGARTRSEIAWYACNEQGTPEIYESNTELGALLMQKLAPAVSLKQLVREGKDDEATLQLAGCIRNLRPSPPSSFVFKHVAELAKDLKSLEGKVDATQIDKARGIFRDHTTDRSRDFSLHGDIHHDNVLRHEDRWLVIDPHGYLGPRAFEAGAMLRNPYDCFPGGELRRVIHRRLELLIHELPFPRDEILGWCFAYTMMAASWSAKDHAEVPKEHLAIAELVASFP